MYAKCHRQVRRLDGAALNLTSDDRVPPVKKVGVQQAFQLSLQPGDSVYVTLRLLPWRERVKTG